MTKKQILSFVFVGALLLPLVFGGTLHTVVPHSHSENAVIVSDMHSVFRHEEHDVSVFPAFVFSLIFTTVLVAVSYRTLNLSGRLVRAQHKISTLLRRGILSYRKFG